MKEGWKIKKLGEICDSINGLWKGKKGPFVTVGVLRSTNFTKDCRLNLTNVIYLEVEEKTFEKRKLREGDIIVERSGGGPNQPVGRAVLFKEITGNFSFCNFTSVLRIKETTQLIPKYLHKYLAYFYLSGGTTEMQSYTIGLRNLDYNRYLQIDIPIPSKKEQLRIIEILDAEFAKIDALRANVTKSLQAAKDLFQSALKQELQPKENWTVKNLKEITEAIGDGLHGTPNYVANGDCYFINGNNLIEGKIVFNKNTKKVSNVEKEKYYIPLNSQTILISINGSLGRTAFYNGENIILGKSVCFIILKAGVNKYFVYHILTSNIFMEYAEKEYTGLTIKNISLKSMRNFVIHFPPDKEQTRIVSRLDQLNERCKTLQENYDRTITLCEDLKQALLRKAFNGEL